MVAEAEAVDVPLSLADPDVPRARDELLVVALRELLARRLVGLVGLAAEHRLARPWPVNVMSISASAYGFSVNAFFGSVISSGSSSSTTLPA